MTGDMSEVPLARAFEKGVGFDHAQVADLQARINETLAQLTKPNGSASGDLVRSVRHSLLAPGKRVRALVVLLCVDELGGDVEQAMLPACAVELLHTASLIVDDLPAMDDAHLRRGRESNHVTFGEDTAILAAITMLCDVFGMLARCTGLDAQCRIEIIDKLSSVVGLEGLAAGQYFDLRAAHGELTLPEVERIHRLKTGTLFAASAWLGARIAGCPSALLSAVHEFGMKIGLAFQTYDDLVDRHGSRETAGKDVLVDRRKATLVTLEGTDAALARADRHFDEAVDLLDEVGIGDGRLALFMTELRDMLRGRMVLRPEDATRAR